MDKFGLMAVAMGEQQAELVLKNASIVDVLAGRIFTGDVAIVDGVIAGVGSYSGVTELDCTGQYLAPGFINCHCHIESVMITPGGYAVEEVKCGVTTIITDPHEIANVAGTAGLDYMLAYREQLPLDYYLQLPSCVPATPAEHAGAVLTASELAPYASHPAVLGLGEMMDVHGVLEGNSSVHDKLVLFPGGLVDGHSPGLAGGELSAYILSGVTTDHESTTFGEALEKVTRGMSVLVREGSAGRNLVNILTHFIEQGLDTRNLAFCTDDKHLGDIMTEGTISHCICLAVSLGMPPVTAIQLATINAARIYRLDKRGAVAPGYRADLVLLGSLDGLEILRVYKDGKLVCADGQYLGVPPTIRPCSNAIAQSVRLPALSRERFALPPGDVLPVITMLPGEIITRRETVTQAQAAEGLEDGTLCKLLSIERHGGSGGVGVGLLRGYGLTGGAVACTVAHDSHNLLAAGNNDNDLLLAIRRVAELQGGYVLVQRGKVTCELPLPIAGLMSPLPAEQLGREIEQMVDSLRGAGVPRGIDPLVTLSFMALPVIPEVRITDRGVLDVDTGEIIG